jgi:hypothetical protein
MQNGEPNVYAAVVTMRNAYMLMQWQRVQMLLAFNVVATPTMYAIEIEDVLKAAISFVGLFLHLGLLMASRRAEQWIKYYDVKLATLERYSEVDDRDTKLRFSLFSDPDFADFRNRRVASRFIFSYLGICILLYWSWNSFVFLFP